MFPNSMQLSQLMKNGRARHRIKSGKRKARAPCMRKCSISRFTWTSLFLILVPLDWGIQSKIRRGCLPNAHSLTDSPQKNCCSSNVWMHGKTWQTIRRACFAICTHTLSLYQTCEQSWHTELPTLASEERERERQKLQEKAREGEKRRKPQQMKNSVSEVCPFAVKAWFCIDQFQSSSGISTLPTSWLRRECALAQTAVVAVVVSL